MADAQDRALLEATYDALGLSESAKTAMLAVTHAPIGKGGSNYVTRSKPGNTGQYPAYFQQVRNAIIKTGKTVAEASAITWDRLRAWARGEGNVGPEVRAAARKTLAELKAVGSKAKIKETPVGVLAMELTAEQVGDLSLLEASTTPPMSSTPRRPGESLTSWGKRLQAGDTALAAKQAKTSKTRSGSAQGFNALHPRTRGGKWTFKSGASGTEVRSIQRRVGAKADGQFGNLTKSAVMAYQRRHGLQVDGVVGAQTVAAMRGRGGKVAPGAMSAGDRAWLARKH